MANYRTGDLDDMCAVLGDGDDDSRHSRLEYLDCKWPPDSTMDVDIMLDGRRDLLRVDKKSSRYDSAKEIGQGPSLAP